MNSYIEIVIIIPVLVLCYQFYSFSIKSEGVKLQNRSRLLGIVLMTLGVTALTYRTIAFAFFGLILIMFGFRLMAKGLDRLNKKIFIDQCEDDK